MITVQDRLITLTTESTSYIMWINETNHLEQLYYGPKLDAIVDIDSIKMRYQFEQGSATSYDQDHKGLMLHQLLLEIPTYGKGDYREPMIHLELPDGNRTIDLTYDSHELIENLSFPNLPEFRKPTTLAIHLEDTKNHIRVTAYYTPLVESNVIIRNVVLYNDNKEDIVLDRILSANIDMPYRNQILSKLDGAWIRERHVTDVPLTYGTLRLDSKKGVSSADHNPFFVIKDNTTTETHGYAFGMALVYSGNFEANIEIQSHELLRMSLGINSFDFRYTVHPNESFTTPEVVLSVTANGLSTLSQQFHHAINQNLIAKEHQKDRPIVINNWEATYFDFNEKKLLAIAKKAHKLGIELFCLDDGWFGKRDDDYRSLGDWHTNPKKVRSGLKRFGDKIRSIGLQFGLWVEPEMVNEDSDLFRAHPEWAIGTVYEPVAIGRNQRMLDLANPEVVSYLKDTLTTLFQDANVDYVKWDMNRNISDVYSSYLTPSDQLGYHHRYVLGLYDLLGHIKRTFPDILFEGCSSGGNRFDLGMLYYMPQTWTSDNTDALERLFIQEGTSYLYPLSTISNHVSGDRSHQVFRHTPIETRFNVASFGVLGYELDVTELTPFDTKVITAQIAFYKEFRHLLQYGTLTRLSSPREENETVWMVQNEEKDEALVLYFQTHALPNPPMHRLVIPSMREGTYQIQSRPQFTNIRTFGTLVNEALPIKLKVNHTLHNAIANRYMYQAEDYHTVVHSSQLKHAGVLLPHRFTGTGHGEHDMILEDFGSRIYHIKRHDVNHEPI